jgi:hypothetical protein
MADLRDSNECAQAVSARIEEATFTRAAEALAIVQRGSLDQQSGCRQRE